MISLDIKKRLKAAAGDMELALKLEIERGELVTLYGESGSGKTSILRMLAGLMCPDSGKIVVGYQVWYDPERRLLLPPQKRRVGFVFQDYALFPHMTVRQNLEFALTHRQDAAIIDELIHIMELEALQQQKPAKLSGGQQQRVALARALVGQPEILVLDEPLSALDYAMRVKLQDYILQLHRRFELTTILVSHDPSEILKMSDRVFELKNGKITRQATPVDFFRETLRSARVSFSGEVIRLVQEGRAVVATLRVNGEELQVPLDETQAEGLKPGDRIEVATRTFDAVVRKV